MQGLYKFYWDCGRMGSIDGVFIADSVAIENLIGKEVYFGEVLGKHSEVYGVIEKDDITLVTNDPSVIDALGDFSAGHNPLDYVEEEEDEDGEEEE